MANFEYQGFATLGVNLNRQKYGPLDISQVFKTQGDLNYYLSKGADKTAVSTYWADVVPYPYAGQVVALSADGADPRLFVLKEKADGTFETAEVGFSGDTSALKDRVTALENAVGKEAAGEEAATGLFARMAAAEADIDGVQHELDDSEAGTFAYATGQHLYTIDQQIGTKKSGDTAATGLYKYIDDSVAAATPADYADVKAQVETNKTDIATLVGTDADKSARTIASEEVAKIVAGADTAYDTLKEISDWISGHTTDAAAMNSDINALKTTVGDAESGLVKDTADLKTAVGDSTKGLTKDVADLKTGKQDKLTAGTGIDIADNTVKIDGSVARLEALDVAAAGFYVAVGALASYGDTAPTWSNVFVDSETFDSSNPTNDGRIVRRFGANGAVSGPAPTKDNEYANKKYVDDAAANASSAATGVGNMLSAHEEKMASETAAGHMSATDKAKLDKLKELTKANIDEAYGTGNDALTTKGYVDEQVKTVGDAAITNIKLNGANLEKDAGMVNIPLATQEADGLMSAADKAAFDALTAGGVTGAKIGADGALISPTDGVLTLPIATTTTPGAMSAADKTKLDSAMTSFGVQIEGKSSASLTVDKDNNLILSNEFTTGAPGYVLLREGGIEASKIAAGAISAEKLAANAVETAKIKDAAVTTDKVADAAITDAKIAAVSVTKLTQANTEAEVLILYGGNASGHVHA